MNKETKDTKYKIKNKFGDVLKKQLELKNVPLKKMCDDLGINRSYMYRYINSDDKIPASDLLRKIENYLELPEGFFDQYVYYIDDNIFFRMKNRLKSSITGTPIKYLILEDEFNEIKSKYNDLFQNVTNFYKIEIIQQLNKLIQAMFMFEDTGDEEILEFEHVPADKQHIGNRIAIALDTLDLSYAEASRLTGVKSSLFCEYINHVKCPTRETTEKIRVGLGLPEEFFTSDNFYAVGDQFFFSKYQRGFSPDVKVANKKSLDSKHIPENDYDLKWNEKLSNYNAMHSIWNCITSIRRRCGDDRKEKLNKALNETYLYLYENAVKLNQIKKDDTESD